MNQGGPNPKELKRMHLEGEVSHAQSVASRSAERLGFGSVLASVNERLTLLDTLASEVQRARGRGYVWAGDLELKLEEARKQGPRALETVRQESAKTAQQLRQRVDALQRDVRRISGVDVFRAESTIESAAQEARAFDSAIDGAEKRVREAIATFLTLVDLLKARVEKVHWSLNLFESASFKMQPEENPILAVKATWEDSPKGKRDGVILLTDHRVRFEHLEEVVLERTMLFFASKTEWKKSLMLDVPLGRLAGSEDSERGLLIKDQLLTFAFTPGAGAPQRATFEVDDVSAKEVDALVEQLRKGDFERTRYQGSMPQASNVGVPVRWPSKCDDCGAALVPPVKGQTIIVCNYCKANHDVVLGQG